jgi:hypothetical protein
MQLVHSILGSFLTLPVCGDKLLSLTKESNTAKFFSIEDSRKLNQTENESPEEARKEFNEVCKQVVIPDIAPDSLLNI